MFLLLGDSHMENSNYEGAIRLFERAQIQSRYHGSLPLSVISLVSFVLADLSRI